MKLTMISLRFQVYLPLHYSPKCILSSSVDPINSTSDDTITFSTFTPTTYYYNIRNILTQLYQQPAVIVLQDKLISEQTSITENHSVHLQKTHIYVEQDPRFFQILNQYIHLYNRSFSRTPCTHYAILLLDWHIIWIPKQEHYIYGLTSILKVPLVEWV